VYLFVIRTILVAGNHVHIPHKYSFSPLGDSALLIELGNCIDADVNETVLKIFDSLSLYQVPGVTDIVPAYSSIAVFYNVDLLDHLAEEKTFFEIMVERVSNSLQESTDVFLKAPRQIKVPLCIEKDLAPDLEAVASLIKMSATQVVEIFLSKTYRVFMTGFLPGFAYMGELDDRIAVPRRTEPRRNVPEGSIGIAGKQTGIYPVNSPGGWNIIGTTPLKIFDKNAEDPVLFHPGDEVIFYPITAYEFENYQGRNA
jgi:inhibitor of KinA